MKSDYFTKVQRKEKADVNNKTNFISPEGDGAFEVPPKKFEYGRQPLKGSNDSSGIQALIKDLKASHFDVGKNSVPPMRSSDEYGIAALSAKKPQRAPWASMKTNYALGSDPMSRTAKPEARSHS